MTARSMTACTALVLTALVVSACGGKEPDVAAAPPSSTVVAPTPSSVVAPEPAAVATVEQFPTAAVPDPSTAASPPTQRRVVPCLDPSSPVVQNAIAGLWAPFPTGWRVTDRTPGTSAEGCPTISWALARDTTIRDATSVAHVMFFHKSGRYIGQASGQPYSYTEVIGWTDATVSVRYLWLMDGDDLCCPTGGPSVVTFAYDGTVMTPSADSGQFPPSPHY